MKKRIFLRGMIGFPIGIAIGYIITIFISIVMANGYYSPCVPELTEIMENEINAVILQAVLCGLLGAGCAASSRYMGDRTLGYCKADRNLLYYYFCNNDADCISDILDGAQRYRILKLLWGFCSDFYSNLDNSIYYR